MRLVMTMYVRDEADIVGAQLAFHLNAGVDQVIAIDHRSVDGTTEILEAYEREGVLHLIRAADEGRRAGEWRSQMADLALSKYGADWVFSADADEFWWPRGGSLKDVLAVIPKRWGIVHAVSRHFAAPTCEDGHFAERMTVRVSPYSRWSGPEDPYHLWVKVAHRAWPGLNVHFGGHTVAGGDLVTLRGWYPIEVLHFPLRSLAQSRRKYLALSASGSSTSETGLHADCARTAIETGEWDERYGRYAVADVSAAGAGRATPVRDTRLRDALRLLARAASLPPDGNVLVPPPLAHETLEFPAYGVAQKAIFWHELQPLVTADSATRVVDRQVELDSRVHALEWGLRAAVRSRVRRLVR
jgi:hypothetical protein